MLNSGVFLTSFAYLEINIAHKIRHIFGFTQFLDSSRLSSPRQLIIQYASNAFNESLIPFCCYNLIGYLETKYVYVF